MGIKERKEKEKKDLKGKILKAAEKLFIIGGFEELSMRKIAKVIDYSPTTIYRFFKDKNDLLSSITDNVHSDLSIKFNEINKNNSISDLEKLIMLIKEYIQFGLDNPNIYKLYVHLAKLEIRDNNIYETIGGKSYKVFHSWKVLIEKLIKKGDIKTSTPISLVILIWHTTDGFILNRINHPNLLWLTDKNEIDKIINMIFNGILLKNNK